MRLWGAGSNEPLKLTMRTKTMLQLLLNELVDMYATRRELGIVFGGHCRVTKGNYNTIIGRIVVESGVSLTLFRKLDSLAYARAMTLIG